MKTVKLAIISILSLLVAVSCSHNPNSHEAEVSEAQEVSAVSADATEFAIDTSESEINWNGYKPAGQHHGTFGIQDGDLAVENGKIVGGSFVIDLNNIDVQDLEGEDRDKLTGHLKSEDFFHVEKYPTAKFEITGVEEYQSGSTASREEENENMAVVVNKEEVSESKLDNPSHWVTGNLTLRDTTLSISFPANIQVTNQQVEAEAKFHIDRTRWNVSYSDEGDPVRVAKDKFIYNTVNVGFDIVADKVGQTEPAS